MISVGIVVSVEGYLGLVRVLPSDAKLNKIVAAIHVFSVATIPVG